MSSSSSMLNVAICLWHLATLASSQTHLRILAVTDQESKYENFQTFAENVQALRETSTEPSFLLGAGDFFLTGSSTNAGRLSQDPIRFLDAEFHRNLGYDAVAIGNHEFDLGPLFLAGSIYTWPQPPTPFVSTNLDVSMNSYLAPLVESGRIVDHTVVTRDNVTIAVFSLVTETLMSITSLEQGVDASLVKSIDSYASFVHNETIDALQDRVDAVISESGIDKVVLLNHQQSPALDSYLASRVRNVDVIMSGGGGRFEPEWHRQVVDAEGHPVVLLSADDKMRSIANVKFTFDANGHIVDYVPELINTTMSPNSNVNLPWQDGLDDILNVIRGFVDEMNRVVATTVAGFSTEVNTEGSNIRTRQSGFGALVADAQRNTWCHPTQEERAVIIASCNASGQVDCTSSEFETCPSECDAGNPVTIGITNAGGIRGDTAVPAGTNITLGMLNAELPFPNYVSVARDVTLSELKDFIANGLSQPYLGGFVQLSSNVRITYRTIGSYSMLGFDFPLQEVVTIHVKSCQKWRRLTEDDTITIVGNSFIMNGGDNYPQVGTRRVDIEIPKAQAVRRFLEETLNGVMSEAYDDRRMQRLHVDATSPKVYRDEAKDEYQQAGCCASVEGVIHDRCATIDLFGPFGFIVAFTCDEMKRLYCEGGEGESYFMWNATQVYGVHTSAECRS